LAKLSDKELAALAGATGVDRTATATMSREEKIATISERRESALRSAAVSAGVAGAETMPAAQLAEALKAQPGGASSVGVVDSGKASSADTAGNSSADSVIADEEATQEELTREEYKRRLKENDKLIKVDVPKVLLAVLAFLAFMLLLALLLTLRHTGVLDDSYGGFQRLEPLPKLQNMSWFLPSPPGNRAWFGTASDEQSLF
jgi:hypothetical protein